MNKITVNGVDKEISGLTCGSKLYEIADIDNEKLFLDIDGEVDIPINKDEYIILSGGEKFVSGQSNLENNPNLRNNISIQINDTMIELCQPKINTHDICKHDPNIKTAVDLYADIPNAPDQRIENGWILIVKNGDCFITAEAGCNETAIDITVNGLPKVATKKELTFQEIVILAFGNSGNNNTAYTITYSDNGNDCAEGVLVDGETVIINTGAIFNVAATDKS